jgi:hypothetical protein
MQGEAQIFNSGDHLNMDAKLNPATEESDLAHRTMAGRSREAIMVIRSKSQPYIVVSSKGSLHARPRCAQGQRLSSITRYEVCVGALHESC